MSLPLNESVILVTGANRGLGLALARAAVEGGARKVYAAARDVASITLPGVIPVRLDVTQPDQVRGAVEACGDINLLINNAGIARYGTTLAPEAADRLREELETNALAPLLMAQAFAPVLARSPRSALVNVLSVLSWITLPGTATYSASKAAAWALTNGLRQALRPQGTQVTAVHVAYMDTDMAAGAQGPKTSPDAVALQILQAVAEGRDEVLADDVTRQVKQGLSAQPGAYLRS